MATDSLPPGGATRSVETPGGVKAIRMLAGERIGFAYPGEDFFANVKVERLPVDTWKGESDALESQISDIASDPGNRLSSLDGKKLHGFDVKGLDRLKLEGGVLSVYLLLREKDHIAITIYLLNQEAPHFKTLDEFGILRDSFLKTYTSCLESIQP